MVQSQEPAETRPRPNFPESRIGFSRHNQLSQTPTKRCYGSHGIFWCNSNLVPRVLSYSLSLPRVGRRGPWERGWTTAQQRDRPHTCQHHAEITQSHTFAALIQLSTTTHNLLTFNTREISSNNAKKTQPTSK